MTSLFILGISLLIIGVLSLISTSSAVNCYNSNPVYAEELVNMSTFNIVNIVLQVIQILVASWMIYLSFT